MLTDIQSPRAENPGGTKLKFFFVPTDDVDTWAKPEALPSAAGDKNKITDNHTLATDKKFFTCELEANKNQIEAAYQGAVRGGTKKLDFNGFMSGLTAEAAEALESAEQQPMLCLIQLADDKILQLGQEDHGAFFRTGFQTGTDEGGERGFPINVFSYGKVMIYEGTIDTTGA